MSTKTAIFYVNPGWTETIMQIARNVFLKLDKQAFMGNF